MGAEVKRRRAVPSSLYFVLVCCAVGAGAWILVQAAHFIGQQLYEPPPKIESDRNPPFPVYYSACMGNEFYSLEAAKMELQAWNTNMEKMGWVELKCEDDWVEQ